MNWQKVSVVVTLYNYAQYIGHCLDSILAQKYPGKLEVIVVDDCSTDVSADIVKEYLYDSRVTLLQHKVNKGYSVAKNNGICESTGDFIALLNADDMLTPDSLTIRASALELRPDVGVVHGASYLIGGDILEGYSYCCDRVSKYKIHNRQDKVHAQTTMVRRSVHQKYGLYDESLRSRSDNEFWRRLKDVAKVPFYHIPVQYLDDRFKGNILAFYRKHPASMVEFRRHNKGYNNQVTTLLEKAKETRLREGITKKNTRFLRT